MGADIIAALVRTFPPEPGVYRMLDAQGTVLYVGKAKLLHKRVSTYARSSEHSPRIRRMIALTSDVQFVTTRTEAEALLLEAALIKQLKPRFNIVLRDDKSFPYILLTRDHPAPRLLKHRGARKRKGEYFGPFASAKDVNRTIESLQRVFLLRSCSDSVYAHRSRPCLLYQIKRCSAPCTGVISINAYTTLANEAADCLKGKKQDVKTQLLAAMQKASHAQDFEQAAVYRDRLSALHNIHTQQSLSSGIRDADIFAIQQQGGLSCVQILMFRNGQNCGSKSYFPRNDEAVPGDELLRIFIAQFYAGKDIPPLLLLATPVRDQKVLAEALTMKTGHRVNILLPKHGPKHIVTTHALHNAHTVLMHRLNTKTSHAKQLGELAHALGLPQTPDRIEVFDNSHTQGSHPVGVMIVSGPEGFLKEHYRKFNMTSPNSVPGDDYAMMREMLSRRFADPHKDLSLLPDLVIVDGGSGQLACAINVLSACRLGHIPVVAIAKGVQRNAGQECFFMAEKGSFMLHSGSAALYFMQVLRDEAHRFAVGSHRRRRESAVRKSSLDAIPRIGARRKIALLRHFGSLKAIQGARREDLEAVEGIGALTARLIHDHFHG